MNRIPTRQQQTGILKGTTGGNSLTALGTPKTNVQNKATLFNRAALASSQTTGHLSANIRNSVTSNKVPGGVSTKPIIKTPSSSLSSNMAANPSTKTPGTGGIPAYMMPTKSSNLKSRLPAFPPSDDGNTEDQSENQLGQAGEELSNYNSGYSQNTPSVISRANHTQFNGIATPKMGVQITSALKSVPVSNLNAGTAPSSIGVLKSGLPPSQKYVRIDNIIQAQSSRAAMPVSNVIPVDRINDERIVFVTPKNPFNNVGGSISQASISSTKAVALQHACESSNTYATSLKSEQPTKPMTFSNVNSPQPQTFGQPSHHGTQTAFTQDPPINSGASTNQKLRKFGVINFTVDARNPCAADQLKEQDLNLQNIPMQHCCGHGRNPCLTDRSLPRVAQNDVFQDEKSKNWSLVGSNDSTMAYGQTMGAPTVQGKAKTAMHDVSNINYYHGEISNIANPSEKNSNSELTYEGDSTFISSQNPAPKTHPTQTVKYSDNFHADQDKSNRNDDQNKHGNSRSHAGAEITISDKQGKILSARSNQTSRRILRNSSTSSDDENGDRPPPLPPRTFFPKTPQADTGWKGAQPRRSMSVSNVKGYDLRDPKQSLQNQNGKSGVLTGLQEVSEQVTGKPIPSQMQDTQNNNVMHGSKARNDGSDNEQRLSGEKDKKKERKSFARKLRKSFSSIMTPKSKRKAKKQAEHSGEGE